MLQKILKNDIKSTKDDDIVLHYINYFKGIKKYIYCHEDDPKFLCQCKDCGYYFCNNKHMKTSHIIHLKQCNHQKIILFNPEEKICFVINLVKKTFLNCVLKIKNIYVIIVLKRKTRKKNRKEFMMNLRNKWILIF